MLSRWVSYFCHAALERLPERGFSDTIVGVGLFRQRLSSLPDKRMGENTRYGIEDAALSA
ncbi:MAG TPA: hypothetical protein IGS17_11395 [Oscillatoriales cyanobacterium M59_W2019_021]|nr:hypothetical protein [Oscillatoriales cyanobacterium M4454_W2019_049]HIK51509.1 hypothetical protein [Oscillatoriales cyanobacterium M59_W2019_021]